MLDPGDHGSVCDFDNSALASAVRLALIKLGVPPAGQHIDLDGPGPVMLVRLIRDPGRAHPRAAVFVVHDRGTDARLVSVATYRPEGTVDRSISSQISAADWDGGEPEALPIAQRAGRWGRRPLVER